MEHSNGVFLFGPFVLDAIKRRLSRGSDPIKLYPKEFDVLLALIERHGQVVDKDALLELVWPDASVEESNLATHVSHLRKILGGAKPQQDYIVTIPGRGYRFVAAVRSPAELVGSQDSARAYRKLAPWLVAAGVIATLLLAAGTVWTVRDTPSLRFTQLTFRRGAIWSARFAPDGQIVYGGAFEGAPLAVFSTRPGSIEARPLGYAADVLSIAPSGEMALSLNRRFTRRWEGTGILASVAAGGGTPREVLRNVKDADWSPRNQLALVIRTGSSDRLEFPKGKVLWEVGGFIMRPRVSPNGDAIAFLQRESGDESVELVTTSGVRKTLAASQREVTGLAWSSSGDELLFTVARGGSTSLRAVRREGRPREIARTAGEWSLQDVDRNGRVLMTHDHKEGRTVGVAPGSTTERDLSWLDRSAAVGLSSDGRTVLLAEIGVAGGVTHAAYVRGTDGSAAVRLADGQSAALSPDARWAIVNQGVPERLVVVPTAAGQARPLPSASLTDYYDVKWLPDGKRIVFGALAPGHPRRVYIQDVDGGEPRHLDWPGLVPSAVFLGDGRTYIARDGKAYRNHYLLGTDGRESELIDEVAPNEIAIQATSDGSAVFVSRTEGTTFRIDRLDLSSRRREPWRVLTIADPAGVMPIGPEFPAVLITPDGDAYVYNYMRMLSTLYVVDGVK